MQVGTTMMADGKTFTYAYDIMAFTPADKNNANKGNGYSLVKSANLFTRRKYVCRE